MSLELFGAIAGFEMLDSRFLRILACDSDESGFLDGMLRCFLELAEPCSFGTLWESFAKSAGADKNVAPLCPT